MLYRGSPLEALQRVSEVLSIYWELVTMSDVPVDWRCQHEYTETFGSTTDLSISTEHFTGGNHFHLKTAQINYVVILPPVVTDCLFFFFFLQQVMVGDQQSPHTEDQLETCTSLASSLPLSVEDCCSYLLSTVSLHKRYQCLVSSLFLLKSHVP